MKPICSIQATPIDTAGLLRRLTTPEDGAVASFFGVVRDAHQGRGVSHLEYHAYAGMARRELEQMARQLQRSFRVQRIGLVHRTGSLQVGEIAVAVVVAAPHRRAALEACAAGIEAIKQRLPVWKKEFFTDGGAPRWVRGDTAWTQQKTTRPSVAAPGKRSASPFVAAETSDSPATDAGEVLGRRRG